MKKTKLFLIGTVMCCAKLSAQIEPFIGQIMFVPYTFAPKGWRDCDGSLLPIAQNQALFALLGVTYGGNGQTTFALPDMRGRLVIDDGNGANLSTYQLGQIGGQENATLTVAQIPAHNHGVTATNSDGNANSPENAFPANTKALDKEYSNATSDSTMKADALSTAGASAPHYNMMPATAMKCVIATEGIFPPRN